MTKRKKHLYTYASRLKIGDLVYAIVPIDGHPPHRTIRRGRVTRLQVGFYDDDPLLERVGVEVDGVGFYDDLFHWNVFLSPAPAAKALADDNEDK